ncbi:MAG: group 1 glycosyl transferase [Lachnospiraceae bacterium]|nr:group 1 glycosyl transferase [Lachnospiraceae bacterium]
MSNTIKGFVELNNKRVLFVTTKNLDYIRNTQEINLLQKATDELTVIGSGSMSYPIRLIKVWCALFFASFRKYDVVFVGFAPQLIIPIFGKRMRRSKCKIYEDFFVSLYDTMCCDRNKFRPDSLLGRWMHRIDERTLCAADRVICDTKAHGEFFVREFGVDEKLLSVLYLEANWEIYRIKGINREETVKRVLGSVDDKAPIVLFFGSVLPLQGADIVYEAMTKLVAVGGYTCIFVGPRKNLKSISFCNDIYHINWLKQEDLAALIEVSDLCLAGHFNADIDKAKRTIPGKAFIYEVMGKTMILGESPANREYFTEDQRHLFVPMSDADAIVDAVCKATKHRL